jgi:hypothetical protein
MNTEPLSKEEIKARLRKALEANPRPKPPSPPTPKSPEQRLEERVANKPTVAMAQDVTLSSDALAQRLRDERDQIFSNQEIARRQAALDNATLSTRGLQEEIVRSPYHRRSTTVGPRDSDAHLHQSPEDQLWSKML